MNIENYEPIKGLTYKDLFEKQKELIFLYEPKEREVFENFDIDTYQDQEEFKKYCWRVTEELTEALEAIDNLENTHVVEEMLDGFNFLVELISLYGFKFEKLDFSKTKIYKCTRDNILDIVECLGLTANCLKNRAWRQSQYLVDLYIFEARLNETFNLYLNVLRNLIGSDAKIIEQWSLKYQVNLFRIQTKY